jgi:2-polyprenyl-6-methoxyphenol hydroxylase-like FAD-dependent oxidoreductase
VEILRADLSRVLYERSRDTTEYRFGDSIAAMTQTPGGVQVSFEGGAERTFDLVIGADGLHSNVRRLAFGPESQSVSYLGYHLAGWDVPNYLGLAPRVAELQPARQARQRRRHPPRPHQGQHPVRVRLPRA